MSDAANLLPPVPPQEDFPNGDLESQRPPLPAAPLSIISKTVAKVTTPKPPPKSKGISSLKLAVGAPIIGMIILIMTLLTPVVILVFCVVPKTVFIKKIQNLLKLPPVFLGSAVAAILCDKFSLDISYLQSSILPKLTNLLDGSNANFVDPDADDTPKNLPMPISDFGVANKIYLNTGTLGMVPLSTVKSSLNIWTYCQTDPMNTYFGLVMGMMSGAQTIAAKYLGADYNEVTFQASSTKSLNLVWSGLNNGGYFNSDGQDIVLTSKQEHEGGLSGLEFFEKLGKFRIVKVDGIDLVSKDLTADSIVASYEAAIDDDGENRIKAIFTSHVSCITGCKNPVKKLAKLAHDYGAILVVDGAQSAGAIKVDMHDLDVDVYTVSAQKWTLAPTGTGLLYVRKSLSDKFMKVIEWNEGGAEGEPGPLSLSSFYTHSNGTNSEALIYGLSRSIMYLNKYGYATGALEEYNMKTRNFFYSKLCALLDELGDKRDGAVVYSPPPGELASPMVSLKLGDKRKGIMCYSFMYGENFVVKVMKDNQCDSGVENGIRFSFHGYNTEADAVAVIDALRRFFTQH